jgi:hypothetical protein
VPIISTSPEPMVTARLGQMVTLSPRRLAEQPLRPLRLGGRRRPRRQGRSPAVPSSESDNSVLSYRRQARRSGPGPGRCEPGVTAATVRVAWAAAAACPAPARPGGLGATVRQSSGAGDSMIGHRRSRGRGPRAAARAGGPRSRSRVSVSAAAATVTVTTHEPESRRLAR